MARGEVVLPETKPETEWVAGRALRKVSPTYRHGVVQLRIAFALSTWAEANDRGRVATEWRFRLTPPGEVTRPLVPDVAYLSYDAVPKSAGDDLVDAPRTAPTLAVEILSPDDRASDVADKIATYLACGTTAVLVVDPIALHATFNDRRGTRTFGAHDRLLHPAFPGFALEPERLFAS